MKYHVLLSRCTKLSLKVYPASVRRRPESGIRTGLIDNNVSPPSGHGHQSKSGHAHLGVFIEIERAALGDETEMGRVASTNFKRLMNTVAVDCGVCQV